MTSRTSTTVPTHASASRDPYTEVTRVFNALIARAPAGSYPFPVSLVVDDTRALAGRDPGGRGMACAEVGEDGASTVYVTHAFVQAAQAEVPAKGMGRVIGRRRRLTDAEARARWEGVLAHELGHVHLLQLEAWASTVGKDVGAAMKRARMAVSFIVGADQRRWREALLQHSERTADLFAERLFGVVVSYDGADVQTAGAGAHPRPARLGNPGTPPQRNPERLI